MVHTALPHALRPRGLGIEVSIFHLPLIPSDHLLMSTKFVGGMVLAEDLADDDCFSAGGAREDDVAADRCGARWEGREEVLAWPASACERA
jgi:hypothetical protein